MAFLWQPSNNLVRHEESQVPPQTRWLRTCILTGSFMSTLQFDKPYPGAPTVLKLYSAFDTIKMGHSGTSAILRVNRWTNWMKCCWFFFFFNDRSMLLSERLMLFFSPALLFYLKLNPSPVAPTVLVIHRASSATCPQVWTPDPGLAKPGTSPAWPLWFVNTHDQKSPSRLPWDLICRCWKREGISLLNHKL